MGSFEVHSEGPDGAGAMPAVQVEPLVVMGSDARDVSALASGEGLSELIGHGDGSGPDTVIVLREPALDLRLLEQPVLPAQPGMGKGQPAPPDAEVEGPSWTAARVSVVIPALNEAQNLPHVLAALPRRSHEVILVDGDSRRRHGRGRPRAAARHRHGRLQNRTRQGQRARRAASPPVTGDIIVMLDADGSTDPAEIPRVRRGAGRRRRLRQGLPLRPGRRQRRHHPAAPARQPRSSTALVNVLFGTRYTDLCYGYNAFWADLLPLLDLPTRPAAPADGSCCGATASRSRR